MKAQEFGTIRDLLIVHPVREIIEGTLITLERKLTLNITGKAYDAIAEEKAVIAIKRLQSLLKVL